MKFLQTDLAKLFWILICIGVFLGSMVGLVKSAAASLKRSNGSWKSVIDEIALGLLVVFCFIIVVQNTPDTIYNWVKTPVVAVSICSYPF